MNPINNLPLELSRKIYKFAFRNVLNDIKSLKICRVYEWYNNLDNRFQSITHQYIQEFTEFEADKRIRITWKDQTMSTFIDIPYYHYYFDNIGVKWVLCEYAMFNKTPEPPVINLYYLNQQILSRFVV